MPIRPNPTLSEDLIGEILVRVPVRSLLCLRLVCKAWLSLIKDPAFVKSQLLRAITTQTHPALIIRRHTVLRAEKEIAVLDVDSRQIVSDLDLKLPYSRGEHEPCPTLVGSVNGIVCVRVLIADRRQEENVYLWNPATRQSKLIPICNVLGFGYEPIDHEYKVVSNSVEVYLANRDVWRKLSVPFDIPMNGFLNVCINGFLCGIGKFGMTVFDLHKEVLNCAIKLPVIIRDVLDDDDDDDTDARIIEFNKSIAVIIMWGNQLNDNKKIKMWTLDYDACLRGGGVEASWTPVFSIDLADLAMSARLILGYFNNRNLLVLTRDMWISCNADKKEAKIVPFSGEMAGYYYMNAVYKYTESLVSLPGFKQINWNAGEDDNLVNPADFDIFVPEWLK